MRFANWTDAEIQRWCLLRAIEWCAFPAFASQPLVPIMFLLFSWYWVIAAVVVLNILWSGIRYSYVNITAAMVACLFVAWVKWPSAIGSAVYLFVHRQFVPGLIALLWPLISGLIPPSGKIGVIELAFAKKLGYVSEDAECQAAARYRKAAEQVLRRKHRIYFDDTKQHSPEDYTRLAAWLRKAAEQGDVEAQFSLGYLYDKGQGVPQDYAEAYFWSDVAAAGNQDATGAELAAEARDALASHLTPDDLSREQERARKWFEDHPAKPQ